MGKISVLKTALLKTSEFSLSDPLEIWVANDADPVPPEPYRAFPITKVIRKQNFRCAPKMRLVLTLYTRAAAFLTLLTLSQPGANFQLNFIVNK